MALFKVIRELKNNGFFMTKICVVSNISDVFSAHHLLVNNYNYIEFGRLVLLIQLNLDITDY